MKQYTTVNDVISLFRKLTTEESERATSLIPVVENSLRMEAKKGGRDLDKLAKDTAYKSVLISVVVDVVARTLMTATEGEPMIQASQSALGYTWSGTFLNAGGGLFIKKSELDRLGLRRPKYGVINFYEN